MGLSNSQHNMRYHMPPEGAVWWWYDDPAGLRVYHQAYDEDGVWVSTESAVIPWVSIRAALRRKEQEHEDG